MMVSHFLEVRVAGDRYENRLQYGQISNNKFHIFKFASIPSEFFNITLIEGITVCVLDCSPR